MVWHPDRHPEWMKEKAESKMKAVSEAYHFLNQQHKTV